MRYKAFLSYGSEEISKVYGIPIRKFEVIGGADREIDLNSTDDLSISSEFEQARSHKNIVLFLPPTGDHKIMKAALDLSEIANKKTKFVASVRIERYDGKRMLEALVLIEVEAHLSSPPHIVHGNLLFVTIFLPKAELYRGTVTKNRQGLTNVTAL